MANLTDEEKINTCCLFLVKMAIDKKGGEYTVELKDAMHLDKNIGDWEIVVRKRLGTKILMVN